MIRFIATFRRSIALVTALLFLAAGSAYAAHQHQPDPQKGAPGAQSQCDFCLHFSAAAPAPSPPVAVYPAEVIVHVSVLSLEKTALAERGPRAHGSRAPPSLSI